MMITHDSDSGIFDIDQLKQSRSSLVSSTSSSGNSYSLDNSVSLSCSSSYSNSFRSILEPNDLQHVGARCRSSLIGTERNENYFLPTKSCSTCSSNNSTIIQEHSCNETLPISLNRTQVIPARKKNIYQSTSSKVVRKCYSLRSCLPSAKSISSTARSPTRKTQAHFFAQLAQQYPLLLVLNNYHCTCGCRFSVQNGETVICLETNGLIQKQKWITVVSGHLICSKIPKSYVCDVYALRQNVKSRQHCSLIETEF
ncbi:unnamed protein product [Didymodactylos carnosus]|uniref:Uncharacterized protein n=1 Tax=Didymodactylos carnosus TaxID=1234261 RepID=A0A813UY48_9BILA|nr:unnamed protein product [Didymodactylos carnosus]CAF0864189.1 unnamed protein product [Didymodactylos carnosus]CAF3621107.1 unnamed protein product [Didymodactylos carnosus]CAF3648978.1 unnamed protein product [Didymodactylos carnosus]